MTSSGPLPCRKLLHCVGPRYNEQYKTAAENALHFCYRNALRMVKEEGMRTVALTCVYTKVRLDEGGRKFECVCFIWLNVNLNLSLNFRNFVACVVLYCVVCVAVLFYFFSHLRMKIFD